jgi:peptidoglycan-associated lipoprotein
MKLAFGTGLVVAIFLAACSSQPAPTGASAGAGAGAGAGATAVSRGGVPGSAEDLATNVGDRVLFDFNKATLRPDAMGTLDKQAAWFARYPRNRAQIAGNTDERGTEEYNFVLGQRRANAARDYLVSKGMAAGRITTISYGKDRPVATGSDEASWAQNRNAITALQ